jgi:hypothetical protein
MIYGKDALRNLYPPAKERPVKKQLGHLDKHCLHFLENAGADDRTI